MPYKSKLDILVDALKSIATDDVTFGFTLPLHPGVLRGVGADGHFVVLMPMIKQEIERHVN
jgi:DNA polymerase III sliding clamp (beta) subunit (PCNA family)